MKPRFRIFTSRSGDWQYGFLVTSINTNQLAFTWSSDPCDFYIHNGKCVITDLWKYMLDHELISEEKKEIYYYLISKFNR